METTVQHLMHDRLSQLACSLNTMYIEYTDDSGVMTLKLENNRTQSVKGYYRELPTGDFILFMSKVCYVEEYPEINFLSLLELSHQLERCKVVIDQGYLEVSSCVPAGTNDTDLQLIIRDIAEAADNLEASITGHDFY